MWNEEYAEVNPDDASRLGVVTGDQVKVTSRRGEVTSKVEVTDRVSRHYLMSFHLHRKPYKCPDKR